jgi:hypothetical protein
MGEKDEENQTDSPCHCHGGRLIVIIGDSGNRTINAARAWAIGLNAGSPLYKVAFDVKTTSPSFSQPQTVQNGQWANFPKGIMEDMTAERLRSSIDQCCYFNEVLIMAHGEKVSYWDLERFAGLFFDRPILRLVLWLCAGNRDRFPFTGHKKTFGELCYVLRPFHSCPCGCAHEDCRSFSADGGSEKCPVGKNAKTTFVSAGYYTAGGKQYPSLLELDPSDAKSPFVAPEERLIETTVTHSAGGEDSVDLSPSATTGGEVFGGLKVKSPTNAPGPASGFAIDPKLVLQGHNAKRPHGYIGRVEYEGPQTNDIDCPGADGCLQGAN